MRVLFIKLSSIGDIVHALPALAYARRHLPDAFIGWAVDSRYAEILRGNGLIDELIELDTRSLAGGKTIENILLDVSSQLAKVRKGRFDISIDLQGLWKSAFVGKAAGAKSRWGFEKSALREPSSRLLLTDAAAVPKRAHVIQRNIELVRQALRLDTDDLPPEFPVYTSGEHIAEAESIMQQAGGRFALLNPGGGWVTKLWPAENFGKLADRLSDEFGITSVITAGPGESELAERAASGSSKGAALITQPSLKGFYELAKQATVYVGGDTGPTHIAVAAGTPVVGIFGPTEWWRNGSQDPADICVERHDIGCRVDCHRRTCDKWICMDIDVDTAFQAVRMRLDAS